MGRLAGAVWAEKDGVKLKSIAKKRRKSLRMVYLKNSEDEEKFSIRAKQV
jgi:hypothetical protein